MWSALAEGPWGGVSEPLGSCKTQTYECPQFGGSEITISAGSEGYKCSKPSGFNDQAHVTRTIAEDSPSCTR